MARAPAGRRSAKRKDDDPHAAASVKLAAEAGDVGEARKALVDAAGLVRTLWISFMFFGLYLTIAAGGITHRQIFLETPLKLPVINADLPLVAFFWVAPGLFVIAHAYLLLQLKLLADRARLYCSLLDAAISDEAVRARLRLHLPSFVFVEYLAHPRHGRRRAISWLVYFIAWFTMAVAPLTLLLLIQLKFLPYQDSLTTWVHRGLIAADLVFLCIYWSDVAGHLELRQISKTWRARLAAAGALLVLLASVFVATFPGEWVDKNSLTRALDWAKPIPSYHHGKVVWLSFMEALLSGSIDNSTGKRTGLFSNYLVLPDEAFVDDASVADLERREKDMGTKPWENQRTLVVFRGRNFVNANLAHTDLRYADFRGANLREASLDQAKLKGARFDDASMRQASLDDAQLAGASLDGANLARASLNSVVLSGASLTEANLWGARLESAHLERSSLDNANLTGASLESAHLEGASLSQANLQGVLLNAARLAGATLLGARLQGASLDDADLSGACLDQIALAGASLRNVVVWRAAGRPKGLDEALLSVSYQGTPGAAAQDRTDSARMPRVWRPKKGRVLGRDYTNWLKQLKQSVLEASPKPAQNDVQDCLARLNPGAQRPAQDAIDRDNWQALAHDGLRQDELGTAQEREWTRVACAAGQTPDVAEGIVSNFRAVISANFALKLLGGAQAECWGAQGINEGTRQELRCRIAPAKTPDSNCQ